MYIINQFRHNVNINHRKIISFFRIFQIFILIDINITKCYNVVISYKGCVDLKKILSLLLSAIIAVTGIFAVPQLAFASSYEDELRAKGFPDSYITKLTELHKKYPNWIFQPLITNLDWQTAVNGERSSHSKQLI